MLPFEQAATQRLTTDALIQERATELVGRAVTRQLWLLFLDANDVQLPLIVPLDDLPSMPLGDTEVYREIIDACGAASVVAAIERYGEETLTESDRAWARHLRANIGPVLRGILLSHRLGVRWIAEDDYAV